jgi:hypothetical protein
VTKWSFSSKEVVIAGRRVPVTRGQLMQLMVAMNLAFLGLDIWLAHNLNGTIRFYEWIPIIFGPVAAGLLLVVGVISLRRRTMAIVLASAVFAVSLVIGLVGAYFHVDRAIPPNGLQEYGRTLSIFIFAPPIVGPLTFSLVAVLGLIAAVYEDPPGSGRMVIPGLFSWQVPFSKTQQYLIWIGLGILATLISSVLDHGRVNFEDPKVWIPTVTGVFAATASITLGLLDRPSRGDYIVYALSMVALIIVGVLGFVYHVQTDLTSRGDIVMERFLRGAPFLAPLLFADMAGLGLVVLWPVEDRIESEEDSDKSDEEQSDESENPE